jgi:hypothetical protein
MRIPGGRLSKTIGLALVAAATTFAAACGPEATGVEFRAGYGSAKITPPLGTPCALGLDDDLIEVLDDIYVRALYLERGTEKVLVFSADVIGLFPADIAEFAAAVTEAASIPAERQVFHATHTHQTANSRWEDARVLEPFGLADRHSSPEFKAIFKKGCVEAAKAAVGSAEAAEMTYTEAPALGIASNRRVPAPEPGKVIFRSSRPDAAMRVEPEGHIDPLVRLVLFRTKAQGTIGVVNYNCHPSAAGGDEGPFVTGDFAGRGIALTEAATPGLRLLHLSGTSGEINPGKHVTSDSLEPSARKADIALLGRRYADAILAALEKADGWSTPDRLVLARAGVELPLQAGLPSEAEDREKIAEAARVYIADKAVGKANPGAMRRLSHEALILRRSADGKLPTEAAALAVGGVRFAFLPGEIMLKFGDALRERFGGPRLLNVATSLDYTPGYVVPAVYFVEGGYEPTATKLDPAAYDILLDHITGLLKATGLGD